jgi:hypothetical protein
MLFKFKFKFKFKLPPLLLSHAFAYTGPVFVLYIK